MAQVSPTPLVKLFCGMITSKPELADRVVGLLEQRLGPVDIQGPTVPFDFTHYYDQQMGSPLWRRFVSFTTLIEPDSLVDIKLMTNALESEMADLFEGKPARPVNLDPGYIEPSKLVLASMKNFSHRLYLAKGVYAELTLMFRHDKWESLPWTFPDYASGRYDAFFCQVRGMLRDQLRKAGK